MATHSSTLAWRIPWTEERSIWSLKRLSKHADGRRGLPTQRSSLEGAPGPSLQALLVQTGGPRKPGPPKKIRNRRSLSTCANHPDPQPPVPASPTQACESKCFPGKFWLCLQLAGPQRLYLESGRGHGDANWPAPNESWHCKETQLREN